MSSVFVFLKVCCTVVQTQYEWLHFADNRNGYVLLLFNVQVFDRRESNNVRSPPFDLKGRRNISIK